MSRVVLIPLTLIIAFYCACEFAEQVFYYGANLRVETHGAD